MRILIAPDKFKGTLSAEEVCAVLSSTFIRSSVTVQVCPLADGGEGTAVVLTNASGGRLIKVWAHDPLMRPVQAEYGISADGKTAFLELAAASGLWRLRPEERNPERTTTFGTGELIAHALSSGIRDIIIGCGGSATNDGGLGMAAALGFVFRDEAGNEVPPWVTEIPRIACIEKPVQGFPAGGHIRVISDVINPLTGPRGATATFGPQKGADQPTLERLESCMKAWGKLLGSFAGKNVDSIPGAGAGGGFTAGAIALMGATSESGSAVVMEKVALRELILASDLVITGEGQLDGQTLEGKCVQGVASICKALGVPLVVICGTNRMTKEELLQLGAGQVISLAELAGSATAAHSAPREWLEAAGRGIMADL